VAYAEGSVSLQPGGTQDWIAVPLNRPLTTGDQLWSDQNSRAELELDGSALRVSSATAMSFLNLGDGVTQIQLTAGTLVVRVRRLDDNETYEIDTPNLAFSVLRPGVYRISVDPSGNMTSILARSGQGEVTGGGAAYSVHPGEYDSFSGTDPLTEDVQSGPPPDDAFEAWSADRDRRWDRSEAARYVSPDVVGYEDLDENGSWRSTPDYGYVWYPRSVEPGWAPYRFGHWAYIAPWGYTWVDDQPWGFAPFHYGRWAFEGGGWCWVPARPRLEGVAYSRPVYAPALVAWVGVGAGIAWFALGPREVYVPAYPVSRDYVRNINVSNTVVNTTVINNVYNTTIVNNQTVNVTNIKYVNREIPGAVTATNAQAFASAQPISRNLLKVDQREVTAAPVRTITPPIVPTKQAVLGPNRVVNAKPPMQVQTRAVVARTAPPPPPPAFERRQEAIKDNGGKPLSVTQVRKIEPTNAIRSAAVRIASPATPVSARPAPVSARPMPASERPATTLTVPNAPHPVARPPERVPAANAEAGRPAPVAIHPKELPPPPEPASPGIANSVLEREHLQQQQQLQAQQEQERRRIQQQQDLEHQQLAKEQADAARRAEIERQHEQQTQLLQQQHLQQQQQLQAQQEAQRRQQEQQAQEALRRQQQAQQDAERRRQEQAKPSNPKDKRPPER
jgi:hypothetical protein